MNPLHVIETEAEFLMNLKELVPKPPSSRNIGIGATHRTQ